MGKKRLKAQITIMAGLVFGLIVSLLVVMIESAASAGARAKMCGIVNVGVQSLFSQYSRPTLERYEIFGGVISKEDDIAANLSTSFYENCTMDTLNGKLFGIFDPYGIRFEEVSIEEEKLLTDDGGEYFYEEVTEYMKLGQFDQSLLNLLPGIEDSSKKDAIENVQDELIRRQKEAAKIDAKVLKLLTCVEGVKTSSSGFKQFLGNLVPADDFVKKICTRGTEYGCTGVDRWLVYDAVCGKYYDIISELEGLKGHLDWIIYVYNYPMTKGMFLDEGFRSAAGAVYWTIYNTSEKVNEALALIDQINADRQELIGNLGQSEQILHEEWATIGDDAGNAFAEEINELKKYEKSDFNSLCDINSLKEKLLSNQQTLAVMLNVLGELSMVEMDINSIGSVYGMVDNCIQVCSAYDACDIKFNYDGVTLGKGKSLSVIEKIQKTLSDGLMGLVLDDCDKVSKKTAKYGDLSSMVCSYNNSQKVSLSDYAGLYQDFLFNKYLNMNFSSYLNPNSEGLIEYEIEYVLGKTTGDYENLKETVTKLVGLRFAINFVYLLCNYERKSMCRDMAVAMLGFTGVYGIIKLGQYLLMSAWAYGEAVNDAKILLAGGKVPIKKDENSWKTDLEDIVEGGKYDSDNGNMTGLKYEEYLQLLLFLESKGRKIFRTMDVMEINMIHNGYGHIRMYKYLYSVKGTAIFKYLGGKYEYVQEFEFSY